MFGIRFKRRGCSKKDYRVINHLLRESLLSCHSPISRSLWDLHPWAKGELQKNPTSQPSAIRQEVFFLRTTYPKRACLKDKHRIHPSCLCSLVCFLSSHCQMPGHKLPPPLCLALSPCVSLRPSRFPLWNEEEMETSSLHPGQEDKGGCMEIQTALLLQAIPTVQLAIHFIWFWSNLNLESARENFYQARWKTPRIGPSDGGVGNKKKKNHGKRNRGGWKTYTLENNF
nr:uncharacterized protein LOC105477622 isoform X3 [Macaca nemestrina]XP_011732475.1 uncharacterized protein LOC105477622 isoform X3 [Macaca nemestrina]XP_011732476.1 uncharacterized protein LOC105477622 isoform X3 [Macaca nemestrina]